ncbi:MAG TPA: hypothetical protein VN634_19770 [Candidatus Limnocylindrales bacterium]|nr:hypothetical protein [Candidatus Limnocylindrales bacterium]
MSIGTKVEISGSSRVVVGRLDRVRRGKRTAFEATLPKPSAEPSHANAALALALAHAIQRSIDSGENRNQADVARKLQTTRARVTQLLDLTLLDPRIQKAVLRLTDTDMERISERTLRRIGSHESWSAQSAAWDDGVLIESPTTLDVPCGGDDRLT